MDEVKVTPEMGCKLLIKQLEKAEESISKLRYICTAFDDVLSCQSGTATKEQWARFPAAYVLIRDENEVTAAVLSYTASLEQSLRAVSKIKDVVMPVLGDEEDE